jgi:hypothetical protein
MTLVYEEIIGLFSPVGSYPDMKSTIITRLNKGKQSLVVMTITAILITASIAMQTTYVPLNIVKDNSDKAASITSVNEEFKFPVAETSNHTNEKQHTSLYSYEQNLTLPHIIMPEIDVNWSVVDVGLVNQFHSIFLNHSFHNTVF